MRALVFCVESPWPPVGGVALRSWEIISLLREVADVGVFCVTGQSDRPKGFASSAWRVSGAAVRHQPAVQWIKREDGVPTDGYYQADTAGELVSMLENFAPDVAILETLWSHSYEHLIRDRCARVVLDAHNVEADVACQFEAREEFAPAKLQRRLLAERLRRLEARIARRADQVWVCSSEDRHRFLNDYSVNVPVRVVPNAADPERYRAWQPRPAALEQSKGPILLFAGGFHYPPNQHAAKFLIHDFFPRVAPAYPAARLVLAGQNPTAVLHRAAAENPNILVTGRVPDMISYLQHSSVMLVPLSEGGGTRFKIIEAFAAKLPVVSSRKGVEGIGAEPEEHFLPAEDTESFFRAVLRIVSDGDFTKRMVSSADALQELCCWEGARENIREALLEVQL